MVRDASRDGGAPDGARVRGIGATIRWLVSPSTSLLFHAKPGRRTFDALFEWLVALATVGMALFAGDMAIGVPPARIGGGTTCATQRCRSRGGRTGGMREYFNPLTGEGY